LNHQRGVALVITLILLSVITFTAITFVVLARREKGAVATTTDQTVSKLAAETALERVQSELLANIIATTNQFGYDFTASTNFINYAGFDPALPADSNRYANVNYDYTLAGAALTPAQREEVIANLFYNPRPPVTVFSNRAQTGFGDFRYYLDLNRSGQPDANGRQPVVGPNGEYVGTNGVETGIFYDPFLPPPTGVALLSNSVVGDPEWVGVLERPDEPHSANNRFVSRYAYLVVPSGKTLDANRIHNQAVSSAGNLTDYRRNMGVGTWELNLASFLADLNTNIWPGATAGTPNDYLYEPLTTRTVRGLAFEDADRLIRYRYDTDFRSLRPVQRLFNPIGVNAFVTDRIDGFGSGPIFLTNLWPDAIDQDVTRTRVPYGWPGDESPRAYFTPSDFLDPYKVGSFAPRLLLQTLPTDLLATGQNPRGTNSTYNRYTFYRLLSQLGTDGGKERDNKVNINYDNRVRSNPFGVVNVTNFYTWEPVNFFVESANALLREYNTDHYRRVFGDDFVNDTDNNFATAIPVMTNGVFIYTPSINRLLQLAANVYDATTNRTPDYPHLPSMFRPILADNNQLAARVQTPLPPDSLFIVDWQEVTTNWTGLVSRKPKDPFVRLERTTVGLDDNFYGVPWIIGAKKGLPNFNELAVENVFELSRKLEVGRLSLTGKPAYTNQMFLLAISSSIGAEAWNSYKLSYPRPVTIYATNELDVYVSVTNLPTGLGSLVPLRTTVSRSFTVPVWPETGPSTVPQKQSFAAVLSTNLNIITNSIFRASGLLELIPSRLSYIAADRNTFPVPDIRLAYTNKLHLFMVDEGAPGGRRIIDYVQLRAGGETNLTAELDRMSGSDRLGRNPAIGGFRNIWDNTRGRADDITSPPRGVLVQVNESMNPFNGNSTVWRDAGGFRSGSVRDEINGFISFMAGLDRSNLVVEVPYTPTARFRLKQRWEANDPLVHYTVGDLAVSEDDEVDFLPLSITDIKSLKTIGELNERYQPWVGNPRSSTQGGEEGRRRYNLAFKDPGVKSSDNWTFPTNKFPNVGWLGRVHRGTPWQTVYLKASTLEASRRGGASSEWREWTGNWDRRDAQLTQPEQDRRLFDVFTAALSDNATAGQMSVNQEGLAAWSAVLGGVIVLSNATPDQAFLDSPFVTPELEPVLVEPAGSAYTNAPLGYIWRGINRERSRRQNNRPVHKDSQFQSLGDVLATPELTEKSPFLNLSSVQRQNGLTDAIYERIPQQILGLLRGNEQPRFVVYAYGQSLKPAERSLVLSGPNLGLCTNYQVTAEAAIRAVVQVRNATGNSPRVTIESFNYLPPE
jgi:hypothetical protein